MLKHYLLERVIRHYVQNVDRVLQELSISRLLFGSAKLDEIHFSPESIQDALFSYVFYGSEFRRVVAFDVEVSLEWLSVATRSIQFRIRSLEVDLWLYDPAATADHGEFWGAQRVRQKAETEYLRSPAESTLLYKVLGGFDLIVEEIKVRMLRPGEEQPSMLVRLERFRYCPASEEGGPTNDITLAMRPNGALGEVAYNYWIEAGRIAFAAGPPASAKEELALESLTFAIFGKVPARDRFEAPFYATSVKEIGLGAVRAGSRDGASPLPLEALKKLVEVLSSASGSDDLREGAAEEGGSAADAGPELRERLLAAQQTKNDIADLLDGCSRSSRRQGSVEPKDGGTAEEEEDFEEEEFRDCEEEEIIEVGEMPGPDMGQTAKLRECFRQGPLSRMIFALGEVSVWVGGHGGTATLGLQGLKASSDKRRDFVPQEVECLCSLFQLEQPPGSSKADAATVGVIYAGVTLENAHVSCSSPSTGSREALRLSKGLKLQHRGPPDASWLAEGPLQIVELAAAGVVLRDVGREMMLAMLQDLSEAVVPSPCPAPAAKSGGAGLRYSLEVLDVLLEAGDPRFQCALPCLRLSSVLQGLEDIWSFANWPAEAVRLAAEPLGSTAVAPTARPWWEPPRRAPRTELPRRRGGGAGDALADLERQLLEERAALVAERSKAGELRGKMTELVGLLQSWPEGPLPLAVQRIVQGSKASKEVPPPPPSEELKKLAPIKPPLPPAAPPVENVTYEVPFGSTVRHVVEELQRGDAVQWVLEEVWDRTVDIRVVLRSKSKVHAARCLRDTERSSRRRDFFQVTEDFERRQLPLALEIHLSNSSWFSERRVRLKLCKVEGSALEGEALPWPAFTTLPEEE